MHMFVCMCGRWDGGECCHCVLLPFVHTDSGENTLICHGCQAEMTPSDVSIGVDALIVSKYIAELIYK